MNVQGLDIWLFSGVCVFLQIINLRSASDTYVTRRAPWDWREWLDIEMTTQKARNLLSLIT